MTSTTAVSPRWVHAADALTLVAIVVAIAVTIGGGFRVRFGAIRLAATSPVSSWLVVLLLVGVRHLAYPRPTLASGVRALAAAVTGSDAFRAAWVPFLSTRIAVLAVGLFALTAIGYAPGEPRIRLFDDEVMNLPVRWDAGWYFDIASRGYYWSPRVEGQQNIAFFPAFPVTTRVVARLFGGTPEAYLASGLALSHLAFLAALMLLYQLARHLAGEPSVGQGAVLLTASYPFAVFFGAYYTESFYLLAVVGALAAMERGRPWHAVPFGLLAGLTRPNGFLLAVSVALVGWRLTRGQTGRPSSRLVPCLLATAAPLVGVVIYSAYIHQLTGDPLTWWAQHAAWGRSFAGAAPLAETANALTRDGALAHFRSHPYQVLNALAAGICLALVVPVWRRLGAAYGVFMLANLIPPLAFGGTLSIGRVTATMFPMFIWMAASTPGSIGGLAVTFAVFQGLAAALFYTWRPLY